MAVRISAQIQKTIKQLQNLKEYIRVAAEEVASNNTEWRLILKDVVVKHLKAMAKPEQVQYVEAFANSIIVERFGPASFKVMIGGVPVSTMGQNLDAMKVRGREMPFPYSEDFWEQEHEDFTNLLENWVKEAKDKTMIEHGEDTRKIADRIEWILFSPDPSPAMKDAREGLSRNIKLYLDHRHPNAVALSKETAQNWLALSVHRIREELKVMTPKMYRKALVRQLKKL